MLSLIDSYTFVRLSGVASDPIEGFVSDSLRSP